MVTIRPEQPADQAAIYQVHQQAFGRSAEADLVDQLRIHQRVMVSQVAIADHSIVGHILFSPVLIKNSQHTQSIAGLGPLAVLPPYQNQGIGSALVTAGLAACRKIACPAVVVLGHPNFYPRFGFIPASHYGIRSEYNVPDEVFMAIELAPNALQSASGLAIYAPEFNPV